MTGRITLATRKAPSLVFSTPSTRLVASPVSPSRKSIHRQPTSGSFTDSCFSPCSPFMADYFGRKIPIFVGCAIMIVGAILSACTNGYGSESHPNIANCIPNAWPKADKPPSIFSVPRWTFPRRFRQLSSSTRLSRSAHGDLPSSASRYRHGYIQLPVEPGCHE